MRFGIRTQRQLSTSAFRRMVHAYCSCTVVPFLAVNCYLTIKTVNLISPVTILSVEFVLIINIRVLKLKSLAHNHRSKVYVYDI